MTEECNICVRSKASVQRRLKLPALEGTDVGRDDLQPSPLLGGEVERIHKSNRASGLVPLIG